MGTSLRTAERIAALHRQHKTRTGVTTMTTTTSKTQQRRADIQESTDFLTRFLAPGMTVYTSRHNPTSYLRVFAIKDNEPHNITWYVANATGTTPKDKDGAWYLRTTGGGMDPGFAVVYDLAMTLFGDGYALNHRWL